MKKIFTLFFCLLMLNTTFATEWKKELVDDGNIIVNSRVFKEKDSKGKKRQVLEYNAEMITEAPYEQVINTLLDISKHKNFLDGAKKTKALNANNDETLVYYYFNAPWPMSDSDLVADMMYERSDQRFEMKLSSNPKGAKKKKVDRMKLYEAKYIVQKSDVGTLIKIDYRLAPTSTAPKFLVNTWFPKGPAGIIKRLADISK